MTFPLRYHVTGANVNNISADKEKTSILIELSPIMDGTLNIELPRPIIDSKGQGNIDEDYIVFADGQQISAEQTLTNDQLRTLSIDFENGVKEIEILGTRLLPSVLPQNNLELTTTLQTPNNITTSRTDGNDTREILSSNANVTKWNTYNDTQERFSLEYPAHYEVTTTGNRFLDELSFSALDSKGDISKVQSQVFVNVFEGIPGFNTMQMARFGLNILENNETSLKIVEPITCDKYIVDGKEACSFVSATDDDLNRRIGVLAVVVIDDEGLVHTIGYRADPENFDLEQTTMEHIINSYRLTGEKVRNDTNMTGSERFY